MIYLLLYKYFLFIINIINHLINKFTKYIKKYKFYFSKRQNFYIKLKRILEFKNIDSLEDYDLVGITNLLFDQELNKICFIVWNNNELLRRVIVNHPIKGSPELMKKNISNLILNRGGNFFGNKPSIFFFNNYHQMIICFSDIYLTQPWLRKEINFNDIATLYFISKNEKKPFQPVFDYHPIPFSCLYINENHEKYSNIYFIENKENNKNK